MSGKTFVVICSLLFVQFAAARVARDAPPSNEPLKDAMDSVSDMFKSVQEKVFQAVGAQNEHQFNQIVSDGASKYAEKLAAIGDQLKKTVEENANTIGNSDAANKIKERVNEAVNDLKKKNPDAAKNIDQISNTAQNLIEGVKSLGETESAKNIKDISNQLMQATIDALKDVNNKIQEASKSP